jgi:hypothetical protein
VGGDLARNCDTWQRKAHKHLKNLQENDLEANLILFFGDTTQYSEVITEGNHLLKSMKLEEERILAEVEKKLDNLNITINDEVYAKVDDFIEFTHKDPEKQQSQPVKALSPITNFFSHHIFAMTASSANHSHNLDKYRHSISNHLLSRKS